MRKRPDLDSFNFANPFYAHSPTDQLVSFEGWAVLPVSFTLTGRRVEEAEAELRELADLDDDVEAVAVFRLVDGDGAQLIIATQAGYDLGERFRPVATDAV
ncbi:MAG: hypothetical protein M3Q30_15320 [Actinomycetota bacterium]|nr:hypothetical protein [Actinomycetota bacterium]